MLRKPGYALAGGPLGSRADLPLLIFHKEYNDEGDGSFLNWNKTVRFSFWGKMFES